MEVKVQDGTIRISNGTIGIRNSFVEIEDFEKLAAKVAMIQRQGSHCRWKQARRGRRK